MLRAMDLLHVREEYTDEETKETKLRKRRICKTKTGWPQCCKREKRKSDFVDYGVGSVLYFQFLKYMGALFCCMTLLAIPSMLFFFYGTELKEKSFRNIVTAASLGNLGSSLPTCSSGKYDLKSEDANLVNP